jgi:hypothetical protein
MVSIDGVIPNPNNRNKSTIIQFLRTYNSIGSLIIAGVREENGAASAQFFPYIPAISNFAMNNKDNQPPRHA